MSAFDPRAALRGLRSRLARQALTRISPTVDATPVDGGLGPHPLGPADAPRFWAGAPLSPMADAALLAANGSPAVVAMLQPFLAGDTPGQGDAWTDADQVATRLINLAACWCWADLPPALGQELAGSARAHAAWLIRNLPLDDANPTTALSHAAVAIAGCAWPAVDELNAWRGPSLSALRTALPAALPEDGAPGLDVDRCGRLLWVAALTRAFTRAAGMTFPREADAALLHGALAMWRLGGDAGWSPDLPAVLPLGPAPLSHTLRNLIIGWGMDDGGPACTEDIAAVRLCGSLPEGEPVPHAGVQWALWLWRSSGVGVGHRKLKDHSLRLWAQAPGHMRLDMDGALVVSGERTEPSKMVKGRTDADRARIVHESEDGSHRRDISADRSRMIVIDTGPGRIRWTLGSHWSFEAEDKGWTGTLGARSLVIRPDSRWRWTLLTVGTDTVLEGIGSPGSIKSSFELR
jgi:hypothetical protein